MVLERMEASNTHSEAARVQIQEIIEEMRENLNLAEPGTESLDQLIDKEENIFTEVVEYGEEGGTSIDVSVARLNIHIFSQLARQCHLRVRRVATSSWVYRASDFAKRIVRLLNVDEGSLSKSLTDTTKAKLDPRVSQYFNCCHPLRPLLGAIQLTKVEAVQKERKQRQPKEKQQAVVAQKPKRLKDITEEDQNTKVSRGVEFIRMELRKLVKKNNGNKDSFYHFIVHPTSFSDTVENLVNVSFLLRGGLVSLYEETESVLMELVVTNQKSSDHNQSPFGVTKKQLFLALDHVMFQRFVLGLGLKIILLREEDGKTPLDEAQERNDEGDREVAAFLLSSGEYMVPMPPTESQEHCLHHASPTPSLQSQRSSPQKPHQRAESYRPSPRMSFDRAGFEKELAELTGPSKSANKRNKTEGGSGSTASSRPVPRSAGKMPLLPLISSPSHFPAVPTVPSNAKTAVKKRRLFSVNSDFMEF